MLGCGSPPWSFWGGLARAMPPTPAVWAGTTFITTVLSSGARPPGTYRPTRCIGTLRCTTRAPGARSVVTSCSSSASQVARSRRIDSSSPARTAGSSCSSASASAPTGTRTSSPRTPSKRSLYSSTAARPRVRTASQIACTAGTAASTSNSARGTAVR